jgi:hypothetical protein
MPACFALSLCGGEFSLSPRERAGVRGIETPNLERGLGKSTPLQNQAAGQVF